MRATPTRRRSGGPRYAPAERLQMLKTSLAARAMTMEDVEELLGVSRSTAKRLVRVLKETEPLVEDDQSGKKTWRLLAGVRTEPIHLTLAQRIALYLSRRALDVLAGTGIKEDLDDVFDRLGATLRAKDWENAKNLERTLFVVPAAGRRKYDGRLDDVDEVLTAIRGGERLFVRYASRTKPARDLLFDPYSVLLHDAGLYVAGFSHAHGKVVTLALDGIVSVERRRGERFDVPDDYHPSQLVDGAFGLIAGAPEQVVIRFDAQAAHFIRRAEWHASQGLREEEGGGVVLSMRVAPSPELVAFVLRYGGGAEVLAPESLRRAVAAEIDRARARYA